MKLKTQITLSIAPIILIQMLVLIVPSVWLYQDFVNKQVKGYIRNSLSQIQTAFDLKTNSVIADTAMLSRNLVLDRYLRTENARIRTQVMHKTVIKEFDSLREVHPEYIEISLLTSDGYEEVSLLESDLLNQTSDENNSVYYKKIAQSPHAQEIMIMIDPDTKQWVLISARKLFKREVTEQTKNSKEKLKGYLIIKVRLDFIHSFMDGAQLTDHGFIALYDKQGLSIVYKGSFIASEHEKSFFLNMVDSGNSSQIFEQEIGKDSYVLGHTQLAPNLYYTIGWPESELNQMLTSLGYRSIISSFVLLIISIIMLLWVMNKRLIEPILDLQRAAKRMGKGDRYWIFKNNASEELRDLALSIKDMGEGLIRQRQQMQDIAYIDSLTQLPNRLHFTEELERQFSKGKDDYQDIALLFMDLDGFKHVNDSVGHEAGDKVLVTVAKRLRNTLRTTDVISFVDSGGNGLEYNIARLGGDEFTIILYGIQTRNSVIPVVERILNAFKDPIYLEEKKFNIGISIGISMANENIKNASELIKNADIAMYDAKMSGKNTYCFFSEDSAARTLKSLEIKEALHSAIENNQLSIAYQPQINAVSGKFSGCEALIRWYHPQNGWVSPSTFIPIAEETGLIMPLGRWVLSEVCHQIKQWQTEGFEVPRISINVSNIQFAREDMHKLILDSLNKAGLSKDALTVEVTESSIMQGKESITQLEKMESDGLRISLDDFGTGYSSLSALKGLPIHELKIDKSFISGIEQGIEGQAIVSAIIAMAHHLGLKVVAEGVETEEEFAFLVEKEADLIQGYYFYRPMMSDELSQLLYRDRKTEMSSPEKDRGTLLSI